MTRPPDGTDGGRPGGPPPAAGATNAKGSERTNPSADEVALQLGAAQALARARAAAAAKGLRPGRGPLAGRPRGEIGSRVGGAPGSGELGSNARDPQLLGDAIGRLLANRGWDSDLAVGSIMGRWSAMVGVDVARHSTPERFDRGVLTIRAESSAWAAQLRSFAPTVLELVEHEVGPGLVLELRIIGPGGPSWRRGPLRVRGPGPRDTYG